MLNEQTVAQTTVQPEVAPAPLTHYEVDLESVERLRERIQEILVKLGDFQAELSGLKADAFVIKGDHPIVAYCLEIQQEYNNSAVKEPQSLETKVMRLVIGEVDFLLNPTSSTMARMALVLKDLFRGRFGDISGTMSLPELKLTNDVNDFSSKALRDTEKAIKNLGALSDAMTLFLRLGK